MALVYYQESIINNMTEQEWHDLNQECIAGVEKLTSQGKFVTGQPLQPIDTATTVRVRDDEVLISDGPFAETKEQLGGFYMFECANLDEAIKYAAMIPSAEHGSVEVRPIMEIE